MATIPINHPFKGYYKPEKNPNHQKQRKAVTMAYIIKSVSRLEFFAGHRLKTNKEGRAALDKFKHALIDKQINVLAEYYG